MSISQSSSSANIAFPNPIALSAVMVNVLYSALIAMPKWACEVWANAAKVRFCPDLTSISINRSRRIGTWMNLVVSISSTLRLTFGPEVVNLVDHDEAVGLKSSWRVTCKINVVKG
jgi:hypothetical protein